ncbi:hypothetical protein [Methylobacterium sp. CCH5-D2]|uniref:hypothetical protein n=1 Tax=Methylobacterium sp. CCH5-D2 TaxID=1768765 RepID=UPI0008325FF5|nr:hypothetical protein [Methylobacterium sp. CCH5-D2]
MSECPTRARLAPRRPPAPVRLGALVARVVAEVGTPAEVPTPVRSARPTGPAHHHPLVRAALAAFPGAIVVGVRERGGP